MQAQLRTVICMACCTMQGGPFLPAVYPKTSHREDMGDQSWLWLLLRLHWMHAHTTWSDCITHTCCILAGGWKYNVTRLQANVSAGRTFSVLLSYQSRRSSVSAAASNLQVANDIIMLESLGWYHHSNKLDDASTLVAPFMASS